MTITCHHHDLAGNVDRFATLTQWEHRKGFMEMETKLSTYTQFRREHERSWNLFLETGSDELMLRLEDNNPEWNLRMSFDVFREIEARAERKEK